LLNFFGRLLTPSLKMTPFNQRNLTVWMEEKFPGKLRILFFNQCNLTRPVKQVLI
jgi:hypothetical protein